MAVNELNVPQRSLISIELLRAIAALGVFTYHQHLGHVLAKFLHVPSFKVIDVFGAIYAVPLFFLISGYCIHLSNLKFLKGREKLPLLKYFKRRLLRIYPAYLLALILSLLIGTNIRSMQYGFADITWHVLMLQAFSSQYFNTIGIVLWTISVEVALYILYPLFYSLRLRYSLNKALIFVALTSAVSITYFSLRLPITLSQHYFVLNIWFAWCCGAYLAEYHLSDTRQQHRFYLRFAYLIILVTFILVRFSHSKYLEVLGYQLNILIWSGPFLWFISLEERLKRRELFILKPIAAIGLSSYSLYLLHDPLIALKNYMAHYYLPSGWETAGVVIGMLLIPVICWFCFVYIEKPFMGIRKTKLEQKVVAADRFEV